MVKTEKHPQRLGIGAGGSIIQKIEHDKNDPRIWDVDASSILNVQIIDARTFRLVTGLDPPPTPITAAMYKAMGMPLYQFPELTSGGTSGAWGEVVGVAEAAEKNLQIKTAAAPAQQGPAGIASATTSVARWGLLQSGGWGRLDKEAQKAKPSKETEGSVVRGETSLEFPVVMLAVDDSYPEFNGIGEVKNDHRKEAESWNFESGLY